jgi:hypothetical protein
MKESTVIHANFLHSQRLIHPSGCILALYGIASNVGRRLLFLGIYKTSARGRVDCSFFLMNSHSTRHHLGAAGQEAEVGAAALDRERRPEPETGMPPAA